MRNSKNNIFFTQEMVSDLMASFNENANQITRLSSPLANVSIGAHDGGHSEN